MERMISFNINNQRKIAFMQSEHDNKVFVQAIDSKGNVEYTKIISPCDFVMLYNLYVYTKENNIKNDFINPCGTN